MRIAVASQNFRTVTPHAGKTRRFLIFEVATGAPAREAGRLDLPKELSIHEFRGEGPHPLDEVEAVIAGSAGAGFVRRMAARGSGRWRPPRPIRPRRPRRWPRAGCARRPRMIMTTRTAAATDPAGRSGAGSGRTVSTWFSRSAATRIMVTPTSRSSMREASGAGRRSSCSRRTARPRLVAGRRPSRTQALTARSRVSIRARPWPRR